jgi:bifunctional UDP-N-acetylglucosamine pyrophosphorylase/glucosamine-1-phosphate N-acetyltransferase
LKAVIPAAKKKEDMFPFSETLPTSLMPIAGKEVIEHNIEALKKNSIDEIYVVTNYKEELFEEKFGERNDVNIVHQEELSGTAEAVRTCKFIEDDFIVLNGDVIVSENDIERLIGKFERDSTSILATYENRAEKFGVLSIENDEVVNIEEKPENPENPLINTGIYAFNPEIFESLKELREEETSLTDAVRREIESEEAYFLLVEDYWIDIGSGEKLWEADRIKREVLIQENQIHETAEVSEDAVIEGEVWIGPGAEIEAGIVLKGKCFIGEDCRIGPNTVVENSTVMPGSQLDQCSIENSLIFRENILDPFVSVQNSVLGEECDVKSGTGIRESLIGARSFIEANNSILGTKFVPDARTDIGEISK